MIFSVFVVLFLHLLLVHGKYPNANGKFVLGSEGLNRRHASSEKPARKALYRRVDGLAATTSLDPLLQDKPKKSASSGPEVHKKVKFAEGPVETHQYESKGSPSRHYNVQGHASQRSQEYGNGASQRKTDKARDSRKRSWKPFWRHETMVDVEMRELASKYGLTPKEATAIQTKFKSQEARAIAAEHCSRMPALQSMKHWW